jgi:hypothetical protein
MTASKPVRTTRALLSLAALLFSASVSLHKQPQQVIGLFVGAAVLHFLLNFISVTASYVRIRSRTTRRPSHDHPGYCPGFAL